MENSLQRGAIAAQSEPSACTGKTSSMKSSTRALRAHAAIRASARGGALPGPRASTRRARASDQESAVMGDGQKLQAEDLLQVLVLRGPPGNSWSIVS